MKGIFISYRRADSAPYAGRICDHLRRTFPSVSVFMDVEAINPGADFVKAVDANLAGSAVVLAVIGPQWESIRDSNGQPRVGNPNDYVVRELATAIQRQANVIPLLVGGAQMPSAATLPPSLQELSRRNAIEISDSRFAEDAERLCKAIAGALDLPQDDAPYRERVEYSRFFSDAELTQARTRFRRVVWISFALLVLYMLSSQFWRNAAQRSSSEPFPTAQMRRSGLRDSRAACRVRGHERHRGRRRVLIWRRWTRYVAPVAAVVFGLFSAADQREAAARQEVGPHRVCRCRRIRGALRLRRPVLEPASGSALHRAGRAARRHARRLRLGHPHDVHGTGAAMVPARLIPNPLASSH